MRWPFVRLSTHQQVLKKLNALLDDAWLKPYQAWKEKIQDKTRCGANVCGLCAGSGNLMYSRQGKLTWLDCPVCAGHGTYEQQGPKEIVIGGKR